MNAPSAFVVAALEVIEMVLSLYMWILIIGAVMSWLVAFGVINMHSRAVQSISDFIYRLTEPVLRPIRRIVPPINGIDLSPMILIFIIYFVRRYIELRIL